MLTKIEADKILELVYKIREEATPCNDWSEATQVYILT